MFPLPLAISVEPFFFLYYGLSVEALGRIKEGILNFVYIVQSKVGPKQILYQAMHRSLCNRMCMTEDGIKGLTFLMIFEK